MKLSELVNFKNELEKLSVMPAQRTADLEIAKVTHLIETSHLPQETYDKFLHSRLDIIEKYAKFESELDELKALIKSEIEQLERPYFSNSYNLYKSITRETPEQILNRRMIMNPETDVLLRARMKRYTTWQHPAMIIRPGLEDFIDDLVMFDPLYLIDAKHELLKPAMLKFPEEYQRRLRPYIIVESEEHDILEKIPNGQFGLCFAYNFFNFKPFEILKKYLEEIYQKLAPGGILIMTFNDCDRAKAVILTEMNYSCYTPGSLVISLAQRIGFEVVFKHHDNGPSTWLEIKRPGELTSLRGGQTLAKIMRK